MTEQPSHERMKIEWVTSFLAVIDHGGFAAAAERTFRSQPRISAHISELEQQLGAKLFDRNHRPVRLTEAGIAFLGHARMLLKEIDAARSSVQQVLGVLRGRVNLGVTASTGAAFVPQLLATFTERHPHVRVTLVERPTSELIDSLASSEADVAIRPLLPTVGDPAFRYQTLWEEPLVAVVPEASPMAQAEFLSLHEIAQHPLIVHGERHVDPEAPDEITRALTAVRAHANTAYRTIHPQTMVSLVRQGTGIGLTSLLPATVADVSGVRIVPVLESGNRRQVAVFWTTQHALQPATRALLDTIMQIPVPKAVAQYQRRGYDPTT